MHVLARNHVIVRGDGDNAVVFAHGFGCNQSMWCKVTPAFERDHRVVTFDHVGAGRSDLKSYDPARYGSLQAYADDALEVADALHLRGATFVGHSVGSIIGVLAANRGTAHFSGLVLVAPSPRYVDDPPTYEGGFSESDLRELLALMEKNDHGWASYLAGVIAGPEAACVSRELEASFCNTEPRIARQFAEVAFLSDHRADVARVAVPSLILQCSSDAMAPRAVGRYLADHMPMSTYCELDVRGHCPHLSHPDVTVREIRRWLAETTRRP